MNMLKLPTVSNKSKKVRKPEPNWEWLRELEDLKQQPKGFRNASKCNHNRIADPIYGEIYCNKCFAVDLWIVSDDKNDKIKNSNIIIWNRNYDKSRWTGYSLDMMIGKNNHELTDQVWLEIIRDIPDPFRWYDVYKVFQKYKLLKYWVAFGSYINMKPVMNPTIFTYFTKYMEIKQGKYAISYYYLLYKFTQLFGTNEEDEKYIPLKNSAAWCKKTDLWWIDICKQEGWEYKPTKVYKIEWHKEETLSKLSNCIKKYIRDALTYP